VLVLLVLLPFTAGTGSSLTSAGRILHESEQDQDPSGVPHDITDDITAAADGAKQGGLSWKIGRGTLVKKAEERVPASASDENQRPSQLTVIPGEGLVITSTGDEDSPADGAQRAALGSGEASGCG